MSAGAVRPIFRPAAPTTNLVSGHFAVKPQETMDLIAFVLAKLIGPLVKLGLVLFQVRRLEEL